MNALEGQRILQPVAKLARRGLEEADQFIVERPQAGDHDHRHQPIMRNHRNCRDRPGRGFVEAEINPEMRIRWNVVDQHGAPLAHGLSRYADLQRQRARRAGRLARDRLQFFGILVDHVDDAKLGLAVLNHATQHQLRKLVLLQRTPARGGDAAVRLQTLFTPLQRPGRRADRRGKLHQLVAGGADAVVIFRMQCQGAFPLALTQVASRLEQTHHRRADRTQHQPGKAQE